MNIISLNTDIGEMEEFEPLPMGVYTATVVDVDVRTTEKMPNGYFYLQLRINPEEYPADYDAGNAPDGMLLTYARVAVPTADNRRSVKPFKDLLLALGIEPKGTQVNIEEWIDKDVQAHVSRNTYQGALINNIDQLASIPTV